MSLWMRDYNFIKGIDIQKDCKKVLEGNEVLELIREIIKKDGAVASHGTDIEKAGKIFLNGIICTGQTYATYSSPDNAKEVCTRAYIDPDKRNMAGSVSVILQLPIEFLSRFFTDEEKINRYRAGSTHNFLSPFSIKRELILDRDAQKNFITDYERKKAENFSNEFPYVSISDKSKEFYKNFNEDIIYKGVGQSVIPPYLVRGATYLRNRKSYLEGIDADRCRGIDANRIVFYENPYYFNNLTSEQQKEVLEKDFFSRRRRNESDISKNE